MPDDIMKLRTLVEKSLREMIGFAAGRLMEMGVGAATGASRTRCGSPNAMATAIGTGDVGRHDRTAHPEAQEGTLLPEFRRTAPHGQEGADRHHPGGLCKKHFDTLD